MILDKLKTKEEYGGKQQIKLCKLKASLNDDTRNFFPKCLLYVD
ncbi:hypothetical protein Lepto7376_3610 [[Leptolyngbya] sp. PCC 7376]|nr:hypothetical protein Lepto7376_3610 [[Leptolyngbya] sp. PCC 7376]